VVLVLLGQLRDIFKLPRVLCNERTLLEGLNVIIEAILLTEASYSIDEVVLWDPGEGVVDPGCLVSASTGFNPVC
jgi:hypothetical protein